MCMQPREFSTQEHSQNNIQLEARGQLGGKNAVPFLMVDVPPHLIRWEAGLLRTGSSRANGSLVHG